MSPVNNEFKMASGKCAFLDLAACGGGGRGARAENLPRASRDVNPALHILTAMMS